MMNNVSKVMGTDGIAKAGKPPAMLAKSPMRGALISKPSTIAVVMPIASKGAGMNFVTFGATQIKNIVSATRPKVA